MRSQNNDAKLAFVEVNASSQVCPREGRVPGFDASESTRRVFSEDSRVGPLLHHPSTKATLRTCTSLYVKTNAAREALENQTPIATDPR